MANTSSQLFEVSWLLVFAPLVLSLYRETINFLEQITFILCTIIGEVILWCSDKISSLLTSGRSYIELVINIRPPGIIRHRASLTPSDKQNG